MVFGCDGSSTEHIDSAVDHLYEPWLVLKIPSVFRILIPKFRKIVFAISYRARSLARRLPSRSMTPHNVLSGEHWRFGRYARKPIVHSEWSCGFVRFPIKRYQCGCLQPKIVQLAHRATATFYQSLEEYGTLSSHSVRSVGRKSAS